LLVDLRAAAVHDHRIHADELQQHHVVGEAALEPLVGHCVAAVLDHDGLAVKTLDVGQRFGEDIGLVGRSLGGVAHRHAHLERRLYLRARKNRKGKAANRPPLLLMLLTYYWIVSCLAAAVAFLGSVSSSTPSEYLALARASSIPWFSRKARDTRPKLRSLCSTRSPSFSSRSVRDSAVIDTWSPSMLTLMSSFLTPGSSATTLYSPLCSATSTFMRRAGLVASKPTGPT